MKKLLIIFAAAMVLFGCSEDRSHYLKVYNWADYIDEELLDEFEDWYHEQTGEEVEIIYQTFGQSRFDAGYRMPGAGALG